MITISVNPNETKSIIKAVSSLQSKDKENPIYKGLVSAGIFMENKLRDSVNNRILHVRTGRLKQSIGSIVGRTGNVFTAFIGSGVRQGNRVVYANILETGGIIKPKHGKYLTIPIRAGSDYAISSGLWNNKSGKQKKRISNSSKIISFRKVKQVRIPAFRYMEKTSKQYNREAYEKLLEGIRKALKI